ncbi:hypothetical protein FA15DRAFT_699365, partial [Coprinopsis marcescibilis]
PTPQPPPTSANSTPDTRPSTQQSQANTATATSDGPATNSGGPLPPSGTDEHQATNPSNPSESGSSPEDTRDGAPRGPNATNTDGDRPGGTRTLGQLSPSDTIVTLVVPNPNSGGPSITVVRALTDDPLATLAFTDGAGHGPTNTDVAGVGASANNPNNTGAIVGAIFGALIFLVALIVALLFVRRRRRSRIAPSAAFMERYGSGFQSPTNQDTLPPYSGNQEHPSYPFREKS